MVPRHNMMLVMRAQQYVAGVAPCSTTAKRKGATTGAASGILKQHRCCGAFLLPAPRKYSALQRSTATLRRNAALNARQLAAAAAMKAAPLRQLALAHYIKILPKKCSRTQREAATPKHRCLPSAATMTHTHPVL